MVDRETDTLNLDPRGDKTRRGRVLALGGPPRSSPVRKAPRRLSCPLIFHRTSKGKHGQPIRDFSKQWKAAVKAAKLPAGLLPYDLRRTALRNMVRGGTDYTVAMRISGQRTRSTFDRYNITSAEDVKTAMARTAAYVATLPTGRNVEELEPAQNQHNRGRKRRAR